MSVTPPASPEAVRSLIARHATWYHRIELAPGIVTPGIHDSPDLLRRLDALGLPRDGSGCRVLDVGCRDGFFAFEMERRGARVVGIDYADPKATGFSIAAGLLGSDVEYRVDNVYDLRPRTHGLFDLVLFLGVLYHLRHPMLALDRIRSVARPGALLFVETVTGEALRTSETPVWEFLPHDTLAGDWTNKWAPNLAGLLRVIEECEFRILASATTADRAVVMAEAVVDVRLAYYRRLDASTGLLGRGPAVEGWEDEPRADDPRSTAPTSRRPGEPA